jgi:molybdopterin synthase sulfur carrier subunit
LKRRGEQASGTMKILLFGMIAEKAGASKLELNAGSTAALRAALEQRIPGLDRMSYALAVDRRITQADVPLHGHEEIALLPPFAGG